MNNIQKATIWILSLAILVSAYFTINIKDFIPSGYTLALNGIVVTRAILFAITAYLIVELSRAIRIK
ncbi:hypothetical protein [Exiguobacterium sp. s78]|uniref:hypothetical protein n=1 Tax=Exiguobacterium sp. s78 TaxID=2751197 RepID=UPI001BE97078|nr:hypothetical protein [Exiguobacterium sp. s78]